MTELPDPLTPADCDLRDFPWMPVVIPQLTKSKAWSICRRRPELAFYMMNLWMASWHSVPAASLEDDDDVLCDAAGCDPKRWPSLRETVLRNWVKCSDGLLYHPVVAKEATSSWASKLAQRARTKNATDARRAKQKSSRSNDDSNDGHADDDVTSNVTSNVTSDVTETPRSPPDPTRPDQIDIPSTSYSVPVGAQIIPLDARTALWRDGLAILRSLTGRADGPSRAFLGRLLKGVGDDCDKAMQLLHEAADLRPVDPEGWLSGAAKSRAAPVIPGMSARREKILRAGGLWPDAPDRTIDHEDERRLLQ